MWAKVIPAQLRQDQDGIWRGDPRSAVSYPDEGNALFLDIEERSFWFRHRNRCITAAVKRYRPSGPVVDVGAGNGFVARGLETAGFEVIAVEPGLSGARAARNRGIRRVICGTFEDIGFAPSSLPAVGLFDVLEHVRDDGRLLGMVSAALVPQGLVYLTVPAYQALFSSEDVAAGHFRRYTIRSLTDVVMRSGFQVEYGTYFFAPLPLPILLGRTLPSRLGIAQSKNAIAAESEHSGGGALRYGLEWALSLEARRIARGRYVPFGSSCLIVARKPA